MPVRRLWYLVSLAGCFLFYVCYQEWFSWVALLGVFWLPWLSLVLSLPGILTFQIRADGPERVTMGTRAEVRLMGGSRWPVPLFRGRLRMERMITGEAWSHPYSVQLSTAHCGAVEITPEKTYVYDYLGLFRFKARKSTGLRTLVRPIPVQLNAPPDLERYLARAWRPKAGGGYAENHELRLYRPGDSLNMVHWKLTAKTGKPIIREPMQPERGLVLLTMDLKGTPEELDRKFGRLLWLGGFLLEKELTFEIHALTADGIDCCPVTDEMGLNKAIDHLLCRKAAGEGTILDRAVTAFWHYHIGGELDEA